jgi:hypothetical protein
MAVQLHLASLDIDPALRADRQVAVLLDDDSVIGVEFTMAFAADHQIPVAVLHQPRDVLLGGNPGVEHDR